jgi:hypothetical protein
MPLGLEWEERKKVVVYDVVVDGLVVYEGFVMG